MYDNFFSSSKAEIIINESDIEDLFKSIYTTIITSMRRSLGKDSGWIIDSVIDHCLHTSITEEILKGHIKYCFKVNSKQRIIMPKKSEYVKLKNAERKIKSPFMIYADFESILVSEDNGKQNRNEFYTNKYQKHVACSYGYKLVCVDDKFSMPFKSYFGENTVYNFINSMTEESKYYSDVMKIKIFKKTCDD